MMTLLDSLPWIVFDKISSYLNDEEKLQVIDVFPQFYDQIKSVTIYIDGHDFMCFCPRRDTRDKIQYLQKTLQMCPNISKLIIHWTYGHSEDCNFSWNTFKFIRDVSKVTNKFTSIDVYTDRMGPANVSFKSTTFSSFFNQVYRENLLKEKYLTPTSKHESPVLFDKRDHDNTMFKGDSNNLATSQHALGIDLSFHDSTVAIKEYANLITDARLEMNNEMVTFLHKCKNLSSIEIILRQPDDVSSFLSKPSIEYVILRCYKDHPTLYDQIISSTNSNLKHVVITQKECVSFPSHHALHAILHIRRNFTIFHVKYSIMVLNCTYRVPIHALLERFKAVSTVYLEQRARDADNVSHLVSEITLFNIKYKGHRNVQFVDKFRDPTDSVHMSSECEPLDRGHL